MDSKEHERNIQSDRFTEIITSILRGADMVIALDDGAVLADPMVGRVQVGRHRLRVVITIQKSKVVH